VKPELLSSHGIRLIRVTPGSFIMGSPENEFGRAYWEQQREVTLPYEYYLGATPVTRRQSSIATSGSSRYSLHAAPIPAAHWKLRCKD
jgi:formylglycine-generating enzyme required for sulfatase activity